MSGLQPRARIRMLSLRDMIRTTRRPSAALSLLTIICFAALVASGCGGSSRAKAPDAASSAGKQSRPENPAMAVDTDQRRPEGKKPRKTSRVGVGHAAAINIPTDQLSDVSEVAVTAVVTRIDSAVLNTPSGDWDPPAGASDQELHNLFSELTPYTTVHLKIGEVLGARPERTIDVSAGEAVTLTVLGGEKTFTLTEAEARAIGITVPVRESEGVPDQSEANEASPSGPISLTASMASAALLVEGDTVIAFLNGGTIHTYPGEVPKDVIVSLAPEGLGVYRAGTGDRFRNAATGAQVTAAKLRNAAAALDNASGPAQLMRAGTY
jgi:hypothetical protein